MIQYILRFLGFLLVVVVVILWTVGQFVFGDIHEALYDIPLSVRSAKTDFLKALRGESIF